MTEHALGTDPLDPGFATLAVLVGDLTFEASQLLLPGAEAVVDVDEDGDTIVDVVRGDVTSAELARTVLRSPALTVDGSTLTVVVACDRGHDSWVRSGDLRHEFRFTRRWEREGPHVAVVVGSPPEAGTGAGQARDHLRAALGLVAGDAGLPAAIDLVAVRTLLDAEDRGANARDDDAGTLAAALAEADVVIAAWGPQPTAADDVLATVRDALRSARDAGTRVVVPARDGAVLAVGSPGEPADLVATTADGLLEAPADWLHGAPLT